MWSSNPKLNPIKIAKLKNRLSRLASGPQSYESRAEHSFLSLELEKVYADQTEYWQQRSKMEWMWQRDRNTAFFHAKATSRLGANNVDGPMDEAGVV